MYQNFFVRTALLLFTIICVGQKNAFSQDKLPVTFGKVSPVDFELPKNSVIDSSTNAVVIAKVGSIEFVGDKKYNWVSYVLQKHVRVKILNKKAFDFAKIFISLRGVGDYQDKIEG